MGSCLSFSILLSLQPLDCLLLAALPFPSPPIPVPPPHHAPLMEAVSLPPPVITICGVAESGRGAPVSVKAGGAEATIAGSQSVGAKLSKKSPGLCPAQDGRPPPSCRFPKPSQSGFHGAHPLAATWRKYVLGSPGSKILRGRGGG